MSYYDQSLLAKDVDFLDRCTASAAQELADSNIHPPTFVQQYAWQLSGAPGFADAYASGLANGLAHPGRDPAVITDGMILGAMQALIAEVVPPGQT